MNIAPTSRFQGTLQIVRFNWPFYVVGASALLLAVGAALTLPMPEAVMLAALAGIVLAGFWLMASVAASYWIYDRSALRRWRWIPQALGFAPRRWINLHAGLDESTPALRRLLAGSEGRVFDLYDEREMPDASIRRARRAAERPAGTERVDYRRLPVDDASCDAAMLLLSAHELRRHESRLALFREVHRALAPGAKAILAEHLRDLANFAAFGPGFVHFHSRRSWLCVAAEAGFVVEKEFRITPFVAVFVLRKPT